MSVAAPAPAEVAELAALSMPALTPVSALNRAVAEASANPAHALDRTVVEASVNPPAHAFVIASPLPRDWRGSQTGKRPARRAHRRRRRQHRWTRFAGARGLVARRGPPCARAARRAVGAADRPRPARACPDRQLVPEELAVEAQALRGLGLDDEASQVETHLRVRFPDSVLGR